MLKHSDLWAAIDALAQRHGVSVSALARQAGLDATAFNKSKRLSPDGKPRWPSSESLAKILAVTGTTWADLMPGNDQPRPPNGTLPLIGFAQAGDQGYFDDAGYPVGGGWDQIPFPELGDPQAYVLEVSGDSMEPLYRDGDLVVVSPAANVRRGDRVVVKTAEGEVMVKQLVRQSATRIELASINPSHPGRILGTADVHWMARILWASQ